jgi:hypothetical protein
LDIDRTDPGSQVLKRIDGLFYAARGKQNFLLAFPNRSDNPQNQRFECKELEDTAKFPVEKRTQWLADHGEIYSEKAPVSSLRGRSLIFGQLRMSAKASMCGDHLVDMKSDCLRFMQ